MKDEFVIGINYWPIDSAMSWRKSSAGSGDGGGDVVEN